MYVLLLFLSLGSGSQLCVYVYLYQSSPAQREHFSVWQSFDFSEDNFCDVEGTKKIIMCMHVCSVEVQCLFLIYKLMSKKI